MTQTVEGKKIRVSIAGATGYAGMELLRLLMQHPQVQIAHLSSVSYEGKPVSEVYPALYGLCDEVLVDEEQVVQDCDVLFAALPAGLCEPIARRCMDNGVLFIDLGADFRLHDEALYQQWYKKEYTDTPLHDAAVYCIPELHRGRLAGARIVGNPGCYPTGASLAAAPALRAGIIETKGIVVDSKSGVSGAGRALTLTSHFPECNEAFSPYKVAAHRHTPEIEQTYSELAGERVVITFVPHLLPVNRGILTTLYTMLRGEKALEEIHRIYCDFYRDEPFVRVLKLGETANIKNVRCSNFCDISLHPDARAGRLIVVSAIDNMVKGAAGQAIQNMNVCMGLPENSGLLLVPPAV